MVPETATAPPITATGRTPGDATLASLLAHDLVPWETLHARYHPVLELVRALIGVVPNCDPLLEIWPPAFRTYNLMVPSFLDLPLSLFGLGASPIDTVGLGMYVASRTAECPYCSAHTCSFALRRGAPPEKIAEALVGSSDRFSPGELATIAVARALGRIPCELTQAERQALEAAWTAEQAERIVFGIVMMGFLNKFMDASGVALEQSTYSEVVGTMGQRWSPGTAGVALDPALPSGTAPARDSLWRKLRLVPLFPGALKLDSAWQKGVPDTWPAAGTFLREQTGHDFPVLSRLRSRRCVRAIATMVRDNLDASTTVTGLRAKVLAGVVFSAVIADAPLAGEVRALAARHGISDEELAAATRFATDADLPPPGRDEVERVILLVARAASPSPARITAEVVAECRRVGLPSAAIVELVCWLSVLQMLHRLSSYFTAER